MLYKRSFALSFFTIILACLFLFAGCNNHKQTNISQIDFNLPEINVVYNGQAQQFDINLGEFSNTYILGEDYVLEYHNNTNVGEGYVIVKAVDGSKKLKGEQKVKFNIVPLDLQDENISVVCEDVVFNGNESTIPNVTVKYFDNVIPQSDYTVSQNDGSGAVNSESSITISATENGNLKNSLTASYNVVYCPLSSTTITIAETTYSGQAQEPHVTIKIGENTVLDSIMNNLTLTYSNNTNAGKAQLTITVNEQNSYFEVGDSRTVEFDISPADLAEFGVTVNDIAEVNYNGQPHKIVPTLNDSTNCLTANDYVVKYYRNGTEITNDNNFVNGGYIDIKIIGQNNFCGELNARYFIRGTDVSSDENLSIVYAESFEYTGQEIEPEVSVSYNNVEITDYEVSYSQNIDAGTGQINLTFKNNYSGEVTKTFEITPKSITNLTFSLLQNTTTWKPQNAVVDVSIIDDNISLIYGEDYDLTYANNGCVGTATVKATGKGNYTGETQELSYTITKLNIDNCSLKDFSETLEYNGNEQQQTVALTYSRELASGTDVDASNFSVTYYKDEQLQTAMLASEMINAGTVVYIKIVGGQNLEGTLTASYTITKFNLTSGNTTITLDENEFTFNGSAFEPEVTEVTVQGFGEFSDYEVSYSNNTSAGTANVIISGTGNFAGNVTKTFRINPKEMQASNISWAQDCDYDGEVHSVIPTISGDLITANDYNMLCYSEIESEQTLISGSALYNIINGGNYIIKVIAKNNFVGTFSHITKIRPQENYFTSDLSMQNWVYGDEPNEPRITAKYGTPIFRYKSQNGNWSFDVPTSVGKYYVQAIVEKTANYTGIMSEQVEFYIMQNSVEDVEIIVADVNYTGAEQTAQITFLNGSFFEDEDYTLTYYKDYEQEVLATQQDLTNVGQIYVLITPIGEQPFDEQVLSFNILKVQNEWLSELEVCGCEFGQNVTKPSISSRFGEPVVYFKSYDDYENVWSEWQVWTNQNKPVDAQKYMAKAVVQGTENYYELETNAVEFRITPQKLTSSHLTYTYNGGAYTSTSAVYNGDQQGLDFVITDKDNNTILLSNFIIRVLKDNVPTGVIKEVGTYTYKISGMQNYIFVDDNGEEIEVAVEFIINPAE